MTVIMQRLFIFLFILLGITNVVVADVVKPALVEVSAYTNGTVKVEIRASIEALLTGINAQYKNTKDAPTAAEYDELRVMQPDDLQKQFLTFQREMLEQISLNTDDNKIQLAVDSVSIPQPGYTKVPRISVIMLSGKLDRSAKHLQWYYPARFGDNAVRVRQVDEDNEKWHWSEWQWLRDDNHSELFSLEEIFTQRPITEVIFSYMVVGFEHIVPKGSDHILFIFGIFLLSIKMKPLLWQVTMFTVAHTITLGLSMNGIVNLPPNIVEPLIALSIAYIGIENIFATQLHKSRLVLVFCFGLLHGLGFAGVLADFGMPDDDFATALISFNVGVELGQLTVICAAFLAVGCWFSAKPWYRNAIIIPSSAAISVIGLFWTFDRLSW